MNELRLSLFLLSMCGFAVLVLLFRGFTKARDILSMAILIIFGIFIVGLAFMSARSLGIWEGEKRVLSGKSDLEMKINYKFDVQLCDSVYTPTDTIFLEKNRFKIVN